MNPEEKYILKKIVSIDNKKRINLPHDLVENIYQRNQNNRLYLFEKENELVLSGEKDFFDILKEGYKVIESSQIDRYGRIVSNEIFKKNKGENKIQLFGGLNKIIIEEIPKENYEHFKSFNSTIDNVTCSYFMKD